MALTPLGGLTLGDALPAVSSAASNAQPAIGVAIADMRARLLGVTDVFPDWPASHDERVALVQALVQTVRDGMAGSVSQSIVAQVAIVATLILDLQVAQSRVDSATDASTQLSALLASLFSIAGASVHAYAYTGQLQDLGAGLTAELAGGVTDGAPTYAAHAVVLVTANADAWTATQAVFKTVP